MLVHIPFYIKSMAKMPDLGMVKGFVPSPVYNRVKRWNKDNCAWVYETFNHPDDTSIWAAEFGYGTDLYYYGFGREYPSKSRIDSIPQGEAKWPYVCLIVCNLKNDIVYYKKRADGDFEHDIRFESTLEERVKEIGLEVVDSNNIVALIRKAAQGDMGMVKGSIRSGMQGIARKIYKEIQRDINPKKDTIQKIKDEARPYLKEYEGELTFRDEEDVLDKVARIAKGAIGSVKTFTRDDITWIVNDYTKRKEPIDEWYELVSMVYKCSKDTLKSVLRSQGIDAAFTRVLPGRTNTGRALRDIYQNTYFVKKGETVDVTLREGTVFRLNSAKRGEGYLVIEEDETIFDYFVFGE
jgi:hypothetical protein